jgi:large subunit ribosomal protein L10
MVKQSVLNKEKKEQMVGELSEVFSQSSAAILADYRGLSTDAMTQLRRRLRDNNTSCRVVKNTLARLAAKETGKDWLVEHLEGPLAIVYGYEDEVGPSKALADYLKQSGVEMAIKGGFVGDRWMTAAEISALATLPPREVLIAKMLGGMQAPVAGLVSVLSGPMRGLAVVLSGRMKQLEEQ